MSDPTRRPRPHRIAAFARLALLVLVAAALGWSTIGAAPFLPAAGPRTWSFPRDHGAHPGFQTEWWYYTGHLRTADDHAYGYELTIFRRALDTPDDLGPGFAGWSPAAIYPAHFAITDETGRTFHHWERVARDMGGVAGADTSGLSVRCGDWSAVARGAAHRIEASADGWTLALDLEPRKPPILHGEDGLSRKGPRPGQASYYYSMTRMESRGTLRVKDRPVAVHGVSWMDHEFFSSDLDTTLVGWDWFSLQLEDETEVMLYRLRRSDPGAPDWSSGTLVTERADALPLRREDVTVTATGQWRSPATAVTYPSGWEVRIPKYGLELTVTPTLPEQELDTRATTGVIYWEGSVRVAGRRDGRPIAGVGYVELTGYDGRVPMKGTPLSKGAR